MLNVFSKTKPWMVASLLVATTAFGQAQNDKSQQGCRPKACDPMPQTQLNPGYNAPARIDVRGSWDVYTGASFIYWQARQDNMSFAATAVANADTVGDATAFTGNMVNPNFQYKPGFKVLGGVNFDHDGWDAYAEYTWFYSNTTTSAVAPASADGSFTALLASDLIPGSGTSGVPGAYTSGDQNWKLKMQFLDTALARSYYVGTKLTFRSIYGARFAWFSQKNLVTLVNDGTATLGTETTTAGTTVAKSNFSSWGAGPMVGLHTNWNFGEGFRFIGDASVDLLYTRVQSNNVKNTFTPSAGDTIQWAFRSNRPDFLMPHMDLEMGIGWGSYFDCNNWHIDFSATYGFQTFWNANLFTHFNDDVNVTNSLSPNGKLDVHGLTVSMRLDF